MGTNRIAFLDVAKGIGIILVVAGHVIVEGGNTFLYSSAVHGYIYSFHMALFFIISGMLLRRSLMDRDITIENVKKKSRSLVDRLLYPYFIWSVLYFLWENKKLDIENCKEWFYCIITFRGRAPVWFLGALFWAELFALVLLWIVKQKKSLVIVSIVLCIAIVILFDRHGDLSGINPLMLQYLSVSALRGVLSIAYILLGYIILPIVLEWPLYADVVGGVLSFSISILLFVFWGGGNFHTFGMQNIYSFVLNGLFGSLSVVLFCKIICRFKNERFLQHIGKADTLGIMCIHYTHLPFIQYATDICKKMNVSGFLAFIVSFVFVFGVSLFLTEVFIRKQIV